MALTPRSPAPHRPAGHQFLGCCQPCQHPPAERRHKIKVYFMWLLESGVLSSSSPSNCAGAAWLRHGAGQGAGVGWGLFPVPPQTLWVSLGRAGRGTGGCCMGALGIWVLTSRGPKRGPLRTFRCRSTTVLGLEAFSLSLALHEHSPAATSAPAPQRVRAVLQGKGFSAELPGQVGQAADAEAGGGC